MAKSSEVLRLAASKALLNLPYAIWKACEELGPSDYWKHMALVGDGELNMWDSTEHEVMALCLAAAIAESEGD